MQPYTSPLFFNAHALPVHQNEPHAQVGNHLRVNTHPFLGLPAAPFVVYRAAVDNIKKLNTRNNAVFTDKNGKIIVPPFTVVPSNPVTVHLVLAAGEVCLWAQVDAFPQDNLGRRNSNSFSTVDHEALRGARPAASLIRPTTPRRRRDHVTDGRIQRLESSPLRCEAFVNSALGPASVGTRSERRYAFSAPGIVKIVIQGSGRVGGVRWIEAHDAQELKFEPYRIMNLPHPGGVRYLSVVNAEDMAVERVKIQAPKRLPLQESTAAPAPHTAPLASSSDEKKRVRSLLPTLAEDLEHLINDLSAVPFDQIILEPIFDENDVEVGSSRMSRLGRFFQSLADPGTASYVGYKLLDKDWVEVEERLIFYRIDGFFRNVREGANQVASSSLKTLIEAAWRRIPEKVRSLSHVEMFELFASITGRIEGVALNDSTIGDLSKKDRYTLLGTGAIADRGAPLDPVRSPLITDTAHQGWLPELPPAARREVMVDVAQVRVAGLLAAAKRTPATGSGGRFANLNKQNSEGFHLPLVLSLNLEDATGEPISETGTGFIADRQADAAAIRFFIAQQDRFGRWSNWSARNAEPGPRPKPPRPEFQGFYHQTGIDQAASTGGRVRVKVAVPEPGALAPGSFLLDRVRLIAEDQTLGTSSVTEADVSTRISFDSDPNAEYVLIEFTGSILQPTEVRRLRLTAHWIDTAGQLSDASEPQTLTLSDPRPPAQLTVPDVLQYAARPDVTGLSWVEHRWTPESGQANFGIYYSDENRLRAYLEESDEIALLNALDSASDAAARATLFRNHGPMFPDHLYERLQNVVVDFNSGEKGFRHAVSGSLRILNIYKIAAEADTGAKPELIDLPLIIYGVPNADPPQRPVLTVQPAVPEAGEPDYVAQVAIRLVAGTTLGETWRLRRSSVESHNLNRMPIVTTGPMGVLDEEAGQQRAEFRDGGPVQIADMARLKPWTRYTWIAEVQGAPESGSAASGRPVPGRWSRPSDPVSLVLVPDHPPEPMSVHEISGTTVADGLVEVMLTLSHPQPLNGGEVGSYRLRILRRKSAAAALELLREQDVSGDAPFSVSGVADEDPLETVPVNTEYVIELFDPLGRSSGATSATIN
jgi:hypothetical protein